MMAPKVDARRRAREAKARLDAERVERDRKIEEATTAFYVADDKLTDLRDELAAAETDRNQTIVGLFGLDETAERIAVLTGLTVAEVRRIKREAGPTHRTGDESGSDKNR